MGRHVATQTAVPGIHISTKNDYVIMSGDYRVSTEYRKLQIMAVRFHSKISEQFPKPRWYGCEARIKRNQVLTRVLTLYYYRFTT